MSNSTDALHVLVINVRHGEVFYPHAPFISAALFSFDFKRANASTFSVVFRTLPLINYLFWVVVHQFLFFFFGRCNSSVIVLRVGCQSQEKRSEYTSQSLWYYFDIHNKQVHNNSHITYF